MIHAPSRARGSRRPGSSLGDAAAGLASVVLAALALAPGPARAGDPPAGVAPVASRDWTRAPAIVELEAEGDVLAVGDVHGDDERLFALLSGAGVAAGTADSPRWKAGKAVLVFTGDLIDKHPRGLEAIRLIRALETQAREAGGRVVVLAGNHEAEFLADPLAKKSATFRSELEGAGLGVDDVASGRHELGAWLRERPFGARVGDWFFCHAGNTHSRTIPELEAAIRADVDAHGFGAQELVGETSLLEARLKPSVWWEAAGESPEATLDRLLGKLGVKHLAFGHQPGAVRFADGTKRSKGEMFGRSGKVFLLDCGMSRGVDDSRGALLRAHRTGTGTEVQAVSPDGSARVLWKG